MGTGTWFVLFPKARVPSRDAVLSILTSIGLTTVTDTDPDELSFIVTTDGGSFDVGLNDRSWVILETREAVERNRDTLENADEVATYDARFEILYDHRDIGDLFNPLLTTAERLAKLTSGVVYESDNGVFQ